MWLAQRDIESLELPQVFIDSTERRQWLAIVEMGENTPSLEFFSMFERITPVSPKRCHAKIDNTVPGASEESDNTALRDSQANSQEPQCESISKAVSQPRPTLTTDPNSLIEDIRKYMEEYADKYTQTALDSFQKKLRAVRSSKSFNALYDCMHPFSLAFRGASRSKFPC